MQTTEELSKEELYELIFILVNVLQEAEAHLEYCNYGDKWERECAIEAGLPIQIKTTLDKVALALCKQPKS